ncbi:MAG: glycosyltransferase family 1 protein [Prolixibacteraceae bacterium]|nr:glycosyltransferase family 1 protein [Prolixibacteraceae bacterium]
MKILIPALGSRGDVQPYLALGQALISAGIDTTIAINPAIEPVAREYNIPVKCVGKPLDMGTVALEIMDKSKGNWLRGLIAIMKLGVELMEDASSDLELLIKSCDLLIATDCMAGIAEAQKLKKHWISVTLQHVRIPLKKNERTFKEKITGFFWSMGAPFMNASINRYRKKVGVNKIKDINEMLSEKLILLPLSPVFVPPKPNWIASARMTGFWTVKISEEWEPDESLSSFVLSGEKPVVVTLGVMGLSNHDKARETAKIVLDVFRKIKVKVVVQGWNDLYGEKDKDNLVYHCGSVPHTWLFKHAKAVMFHGGFGTTVSVLQAGIPSLVIPHLIDQFVWAGQLFKAGVSPKPIYQYKLNAEVLEERLCELLNNGSLYVEAERIKQELGKEPDGLQKAVDLIKKVVKT